MGYKVLIVESPNKAKTIGRFLGGGNWIVKATIGHIIDLPQRTHGIREDENGRWVGEWGFIPGKEKIVQELKQLANGQNEIFIGTDDDIEGEKIAGDVVEYILFPNGVKSYKRVVFHEITKEVIVEQLNNARSLDKNAINSQIARRFVDREVGYKMSSMIRWDQKDKNMPPDIGIGRVVSPALHLLVEREKEVLSFVEEDKYRVLVEYSKGGVPFRMTVPIDFYEHTKKEMEDMIALLGAPGTKHIVAAYTPEATSKSPYPPLITSRLQRGAWYLFGIEPDLTMKIGQDLFHAGLITYHRTESYNLSDSAVQSIIAYLSRNYPADAVIHQKRYFKPRPGAHQAHEAIRPTFIEESFAPENITENFLFKAAGLNKQHAEVYGYIWSVAISTQMADAIYNTSSGVVQAGEIRLLGRSNTYALSWSDERGAVVPQMGWEQYFGNMIKPTENDEDGREAAETILPRLTIGDELTMLDVKVATSTTRRPPRYGVGRFITTLEAKKIGRPSTFATIYKKLLSTKAISLKGGNMIVPTQLAFAIDDWISEHAPWLNSVEHTAIFHDRIELIERGELESPDPIIKEYSELVSEVANKLGWVDPRLSAPSDSQIKLAEKIIAAKGIAVDREALFSSRAKLNLFLDANPLPKIEPLGICPKCNANEVIKKEYTDRESGEVSKYYRCMGGGCNFSIWASTIDKFFTTFKKDYTEKEIDGAVRKILSKRGGYQFSDLEKRDGGQFSALVVFEEYEYKGKLRWRLSFKNKKR